MSEIFFKELKDELQKGVSEKNHPFRYCTFATVGNERMARLRTLVLREVTQNLSLIFYTDKRSKKLIHIKENNKVSILFYHPKNLLQLKIEGLARVRIDDAIVKKHWSGIQSNHRKDYTTSKAPGTSIPNPDLIEYLNKENHFCIIEVEPFKLEYLKLKRPNHIRVRFSKADIDWHSEFLVP